MNRCLDAGVFLKWLLPEEGSLDAEALIAATVGAGMRLVAPPFLGAEVGSVLRRKVLSGLLVREQAIALLDRFLRLPLDVVDGPDLWRTAWTWAERSGQPTLYDACYLAAAELHGGRDGAPCEFWTADAAFLRDLGGDRPAWVCALSEWPRQAPRLR